jgi:dihydroflavonol-4-reductase
MWHELSMKPRVLVTGATGLVGGAIVRCLLERRRAVRALVRNPDRARALFGSRVEVVPGDLRDLESLRTACQGIGEIHHVAGAVDTHEHGDAEILDTNVEGTRRLLTAARAAGVFGVVYTSSVAVYGDRLPLGVAEDAPLRATGVYGISKLRAERLVREAVATGLRAMIVRPCIVYGPGDRYFAPQAMQVAQLPLIPLPDGGRHLVDLVHSSDLAAAHLLVMEAGRPGEAYNVTDGGRHQAGELIRWTAGALHRSPWLPSIPWWLAFCVRPLITMVGRLGGPPELARLGRQELDGVFTDYHFDISKITLLGYVPRIDARTGLRNELRGRADALPATRAAGRPPR